MVTPVSGMLHQPSLDVKAELPELRKTEETYGDIWRHGRNWKNSAWYVESWSKAMQVKLSDFGCSKKEELRSNWPIWQNVMTAIILQYTAMITI